MPSKPKRSLLFHTNKFQRRILLPVLIPCLTLSIISLTCLIYVCYLSDLGPIVQKYDVDLSLAQVAVPWFLMTFSLLIVCVAFWACAVSNKIVGPYERILKDLDHVIESNSKSPVQVRKGDEMFEELLKRVNVLIERSS